VNKINTKINDDTKIDESAKSVVHNVRPAGHIWAVTSPDVTRDALQEKRLFQSLYWHYGLSLQWVTE